MVDYRTQRLEDLNRETRDYRSKCVDRYNKSAPNSYGTNFGYLNSQTYKANNGCYPNKVFY